MENAEEMIDSLLHQNEEEMILEKRS